MSSIRNSSASEKYATHLAEAERIKKELQLEDEEKSLQFILNMDIKERAQILSKADLIATEKRLEEVKQELSLRRSSVVVALSKNEQDEKVPSFVSVTKFDQEQLKKINTHYANLSETLKPILEAAILDEVDSELMAEPVFIRRDGHTYNRKTVIEWLGEEAEKSCILNPNINYSLKDIIPCNPLLNAMNVLLDVIDGKPVVPTMNDKRISLKMELPGQRRERITDNEIVFIEQLYQKALKPHQQALFDIICRDPKTKKIMDDPVFLPDGYVYDRSTALFFLEMAGGRCPNNEAIKFTLDDITPCHFVISVLFSLKASADKLGMQAYQNKKLALQSSASASSSASAQSVVPAHQPFLLTIDHLLNKITEDKYEHSNEDMEKILHSAKEALQGGNIEILRSAIIKFPHYNQSETKLLGKFDSSSGRFGRFYHSVAKKVGTTKGLGDEVDALVNEVKIYLKTIADIQARHRAGPKH